MRVKKKTSEKQDLSVHVGCVDVSVIVVVFYILSLEHRLYVDECPTPLTQLENSYGYKLLRVCVCV